MEREEALKFFRQEITRLRDEEHVNDLFKVNCAEELAAIEVRTTKAILDFFVYGNGEISLKDEEIAEGDCAAIVLWGASSCAYNDQLVENVENFAYRLAEEAGNYGKNIAYQLLDGEELYDIQAKDLFSDQYAEDYNVKYGNDAE